MESTDTALGRYYKLMRRDDYFNAEQKGLFVLWCDENAMNDDEIKEELEDHKDNPEDSLLVDFDGHFPLQPHYQRANNNERKREIFRIIKECHDNQLAFTSSFLLPSLEQRLFDSITIQQIEDIKQMYREQCPTMYNDGLDKDHSMLFMLAVQRIHGFDYLQTLVDRYDQWRIAHRDQEAKNLNAQHWALDPKNIHFTAPPLNKVIVRVNPSRPNTKYSYSEFGAMCVREFNKRCCPKLCFKHTPYLIDDSLEVIIRYIDKTTFFVADLVTTHNRENSNICPFQLDICIAIGEPKKVNDANQHDDDDKNDDDDDDEDEDEDDQKADNGGYETDDDIDPNKPYVDYIGNVEEKLKNNKLRYLKVDRKDRAPKLRELDVLFKNFMTKHNLRDTNGQSYLHHKRLVTFVDRRELNEDEDDELFMYEPPEGALTRDIPKDYVPEWFISASRTCLIPSVDYDERTMYDKKQREQQTKVDGYRSDRDKTVGAATVCRGGLLTLSIQVRSGDIIKLFLYWNGQVIRLFPEDIKTVLPLLFVDDEKNKRYLEHAQEDIDEVVEMLKKRLIDKYHDTWMKKYPLN